MYLLTYYETSPINFEDIQLQNDLLSAGNHTQMWQPMNISTGMYIVRLQSGNNTNMQKIVYVK